MNAGRAIATRVVSLRWCEMIGKPDGTTKRHVEYNCRFGEPRNTPIMIAFAVLIGLKCGWRAINAS